MIYRTYRATTYKEAVIKAKMDLGSNVYIIGRKEVREGGFLGMFAKTFTEITVARNEDVSNEISKKIQKPGNGLSSDSQGEGSENAPSGKSAAWGRSTAGMGYAATADLNEGKFQSSTSSTGTDHTVLNELQDIKKQLKKVLKSQSSVVEYSDFPTLDKLLMLLRENDFSEDYIDRVKQKFENELSLKDLQAPEIMEQRVKSHILGSFDTAGPIEVGSSQPRIVVLVGPTGVGKTTTIAKLAASFGVLQKKKVELLTIDSYRIAAIEQIGKYAELMQLPFTAINSREEFKSAVKNSRAELVFVDTVGRSQRNNLGLAELRNILDVVKTEMDIHLVLSATTKYRDAIDIVTRFNQLMYNKIIITKLDETNTVGSVLSVLNKDKKLSYFTTGQSVPDDIEIAQKEKLFNMLLFDGLREDRKVV